MSCSGRDGLSDGPGAAGRTPRGVPAGPEPEIEIGSALILRGHREIVIRHGGHRYRLRLTASDKLILTK